jgi:cellulose synthase/poly-beta-1,6-N-acetylglucosamine synthase-like glycosyltransferase
VMVKNFVRPAGLARLGLPCLLTGSGMAFPWSVIHPIELASGHLTEDLMLTSQLALRGCVARFCAEARISGMLPEGAAPMRSQRTRWEHGHLQTLASEVPRLVASSLRQHRLDVLALALEMAVPPLSLLTLLWSGSLGAVTLTGLGGASATPALLLAAGAAMAFSAVLAVWARFGRAILPLHSVLASPGYVLAKVPLYLGYVLRRQTKWERTARTSDSWPGVRPGHDHARRGGGPGWR